MTVRKFTQICLNEAYKRTFLVKRSPPKIFVFNYLTMNTMKQQTCIVVLMDAHFLTNTTITETVARFITAEMLNAASVHTETNASAESPSAN